MTTCEISLSPSFATFKIRLLEICERIEQLRHPLSPSKSVNSCFSDLVSLIIHPFSNGSELAREVDGDIGIQAYLPKLREKCSDAEGELELYWSKKLVESLKEEERTNATAAGTGSRWGWKTVVGTGNPRDKNKEAILVLFPYYHNYLSLCRLETNLLHAIFPITSEYATFSPSQITFIGSGPLPISSLLLSQTFPEASITNVDSSHSALSAGKDFLASFSKVFDARFISLNTTAIDIPLSTLADSSLVILASLVCPKLETIVSVARKMSPGSYLVVRSSEGLRKIVYESVESSDVVKESRKWGVDLKEVMVAHPKNEVLNSVIIFQRETRKEN